MDESRHASIGVGGDNFATTSTPIKPTTHLQRVNSGGDASTNLSVKGASNYGEFFIEYAIFAE